MNRKLLSYFGVLAVIGLVSQAQVAQAQIFGGRACCDEPVYSGYTSYAAMTIYGYGGSSYGNCGGYGCGSVGGCGYRPGLWRSYSIASSRCYGGSSCGSGGCGLSSCGSCGYGTYGGYATSGCGLGNGCYSGYRGLRSYGCRPRYPRSSCCNFQLSCNYTGASAACCQPAPTCCGTVSGGYSTHAAPAAPMAPASPVPSAAPTPATSPTPAAAPTPATPPTPGT